MKRIALIAIVVFAASCKKDYTCTCRIVDNDKVTYSENYEDVTKEHAKSLCDQKAKVMVPPYTVQYHVCAIK
jgi:hypothetical protein